MRQRTPPHLIVHTCVPIVLGMKKKVLAVATAGAVALAAVPAFAATKSIRVADNEFRPSSTTMSRGDTVRFRWVGDAPHNVTRVRGPRFKTISNRDSGSVSRRLTRRGTYRLVCTIHAGMDLRIRVR